NFETILRPFPLLEMPEYDQELNESPFDELSKSDPVHEKEHWYDLGSFSDFTQEGLYTRSIQTSKQIYPLLIINQSESLYALYDECPHRRVPLSSQATLQGEYVVCGWHQWAFSYQTGQHQIPTGICVPHYSVRILEDRVEILLPL
ncbi:MAG: Rieske 2Fe-2S domain-containing protein, partial [Bacteroidota bacterium]|nr:Rieske 2Fe-2S domain-containing protein [Bacteroidota bacterium]